MNDDIVVRLRGITWMGSDALCQEAADEIERLRNELAARCRTPSVATTRTGGDPNSQLEELRSEVAAWRSAFRGEDEFDGRVE